MYSGTSILLTGMRDELSVSLALTAQYLRDLQCELHASPGNSVVPASLSTYWSLAVV